MALAASSSAVYSTNAKPRGRPVSRSIGRNTSRISPACAKSDCTSSRVVLKSRFPTKIFEPILPFPSLSVRLAAAIRTGNSFAKVTPRTLRAHLTADGTATAADLFHVCQHTRQIYENDCKRAGRPASHRQEGQEERSRRTPEGRRAGHGITTRGEECRGARRDRNRMHPASPERNRLFEEAPRKLRSPEKPSRTPSAHRFA
jgi:hypothetical protein